MHRASKVLATWSAVAGLVAACGGDDDAPGAIGVGGRLPITLNPGSAVSAMSANPARLPAAGATTTVTVTLADAGASTIAWSTDGCSGHFAAASSASTTFTLDQLPASNACTLVATVSSGGANAVGKLVLVTGPEPAAQIEAGAPPAGASPIIDVTVQSDDAPRGGDAVVFRVTAHDPGGHALAFHWTSTPAGQATDSANGSELRWTAPSCPLSSSTITVAVEGAPGSVTKHDFKVTTSCP